MPQYFHQDVNTITKKKLLMLTYLMGPIAIATGPFKVQKNWNRTDRKSYLKFLVFTK